MKLLVMSDSHRNITLMQAAVTQTTPDVIIHLGDHISDAVELRRMFPDIAFYMVKGNNDWQAGGDNELFITLDGLKIYMTHGHTCGVKNGLNTFIDRALRRGANIALFGHTHRAFLKQTNGLWLMNPGQMYGNGSRNPASYGIITTRNGTFDCYTELLPVPFSKAGVEGGEIVFRG